MIEEVAHAFRVRAALLVGRTAQVPPGERLLDLDTLSSQRLAAASTETERHYLYAHLCSVAAVDDRVACLEDLGRRLLHPADAFVPIAGRSSRRIAAKYDGDPVQLFASPPAWAIDELTAAVRRGERLGRPPRQKALSGLTTALYEHPDDRIALDALRAIPGFDLLVKGFVDRFARHLELRLLSNNIEVTRDNMPELFELLDRVCRILEVERPALYVENGYLSAYTIGTSSPLVVLSNGSVSSMSEAELMFVLGHEVGHIKSGHVVYHTMAQSAAAIASWAGSYSLGIGAAALNVTILPALRYWARRSELSADRAGVLACQDPDAAMSVLAKLAGLPRGAAGDFDPQDFARQAERLDGALETAGLGRVQLMFDVMTDDHPRSVWRAAALRSWIAAGEYADVVDASEAQRRHLATNVGNDPLILPFIDEVVAAIVTWTRPPTSQATAIRMRIVRQMIRLGVSQPSDAPFPLIFKIEVELSRKAGGHFALFVRLLVLVDGKPARVELQAEATQPWTRLPSECRENMLRMGEQRVTHCLYQRSA